MPINVKRTRLAQKCLLLGRNLLAKGRYSASEKYLCWAHVADPSCRQALELLAEIKRLCGQPQDMAFYLGAARNGIDLRGITKTALYYWRLAAEFEKHRDTANMRYCFAKFLEVSGKTLSADSVMAYCALSEYKKACKALAALTSSPAARKSLSMLRISNPWRFHNVRPSDYFRTHLSALKKIKPGKDYEGFLVYLGYTLNSNIPSGNRTALTSKLHRLIKLNGGRYDFVRYITGNASLFSGKYPDAVRDYKKLLAAGYSDWPIHCRMGEALLCSGETEKGLDCFKNAYAAASGKDRQSVLVWTGEMLLFLKEYRRALRVLKQSREHYAFCWKGAAYYQLGEIKKAVLEFERAVELVPGDVEARTWLGEVYRTTGRRAEALSQLERAAQGLTEPGFWICLNLGLLMRDTGDSNGIRKNYRLAFRSWPELIFIVRDKLGIKSKTKPDDADMVKIMESALKICGGYRRLDKYFLPLASGSRVPGGGA